MNTGMLLILNRFLQACSTYVALYQGHGHTALHGITLHTVTHIVHHPSPKSHLHLTSKNATNGAPGLTSSKKLLEAKGIATSNKKLLGTGATLVVTSALLLVT